MGLAFRLAVGVGILGVLSLFGCASTAPPSEHLATTPPVAVPQERTPASGAAEEIDPDCPYLTFIVKTPKSGGESRREDYEIQKPYMDKFSAHLKRVGFKAHEPLSARLEREGFREAGALAASSSEVSNEDPTERAAREGAEEKKILAKLTTHEQARINQIIESVELSTWIAKSIVLDIAGSEQFDIPEGDRAIVWSWGMRKRDTVLDGALRIDLFTDPSDEYPGLQFGGITDISLIRKSQFGIEAADVADWAAAVFLPHARQLCADMNATLLEEEKELERIRDQLNEEIIRVRERRGEQEKRLKLEVEQ